MGRQSNYAISEVQENLNLVEMNLAQLVVQVLHLCKVLLWAVYNGWLLR